jgi:UDP-glucose-4-epimerase GalE
MRVLVTGGGGYIGSHTCKALACHGFLPIVYDNFSTGHRENCRWGPVVKGDIGDGGSVRAAIREHKVEAVVHFAASAYVGESMVAPHDYYRNNVTGSLTLLEALRLEGVDRLVFSSSCATYGIPDAIPITEQTQQKPINPYGETKLTIERALHWYSQAQLLRYAALRYFNAAGADSQGDLGENHDPETHLLPLAVQAALGQRGPLAVFGDDYPTRDGTAERDYIHVEDLAQAHLVALTRLGQDESSFACNLGTGKGQTVREVLLTIERLSGRPVPFQIGPRRIGDPASLVADATLASTLLNWQPRHNFESIISTALAWHSRHS